MAVKFQVFFCISHKPRVFGGGCCSDKGSETLLENFRELLEKHQLTDQVEVNATSCLKNCLNGPSVMVLPGRVMYGKLNKDDLETLVVKHLKNNEVVRDLIKLPKTSILG